MTRRKLLATLEDETKFNEIIFIVKMTKGTKATCCNDETNEKRSDLGQVNDETNENNKVRLKTKRFLSTK